MKLTEARLRQIIRQQVKEAMESAPRELESAPRELESEVTNTLDSRAGSEINFFSFAKEMGVSPQELLNVFLESQELGYFAPIIIVVDPAGYAAV